MFNCWDMDLKTEVEESLIDRGVIVRIAGSGQPLMLRVSQRYDKW